MAIAIRPYEVVRVQMAASSYARFRQWVDLYGFSRLARSLETNRQLVHSWTQMRNPVTPDISNARKIIALSTIEPLPDGPLAYEDIFGNVEITSREYHTKSPNKRVHSWQ